MCLLVIPVPHFTCLTPVVNLLLPSDKNESPRYMFIYVRITSVEAVEVSKIYHQSSFHGRKIRRHIILAATSEIRMSAILLHAAAGGSM
jgi:hypothetical protein